MACINGYQFSVGDVVDGFPTADTKVYKPILLLAEKNEKLYSNNEIKEIVRLNP